MIYEKCGIWRAFVQYHTYINEMPLLSARPVISKGERGSAEWPAWSDRREWVKRGETLNHPQLIQRNRLRQWQQRQKPPPDMGGVASCRKGCGAMAGMLDVCRACTACTPPPFPSSVCLRRNAGEATTNVSEQRALGDWRFHRPGGYQQRWPGALSAEN